MYLRSKGTTHRTTILITKLVCAARTHNHRGEGEGIYLKSSQPPQWYRVPARRAQDGQRSSRVFLPARPLKHRPDILENVVLRLVLVLVHLADA